MPVKELDPEKDPAEEQANAPVTRAEFLKLMERMDSQSKYIAKLEKKFGSGQSAATEERSPRAETNNDPPGLREQVAKLAEEQAVIRQEREQLQRSKIVSAIGRALQKRGVNALIADDAAEVAHSRNSGAFTIDGNGEVTFEHNGESLTLDSWGQMFLSTEKGAAYISPKNGPSKVALPKNVAANQGRVVTTITPEQLANGDFDPGLVSKGIAVAE